jgi:hypothetical protein
MSRPLAVSSLPYQLAIQHGSSVWVLAWVQRECSAKIQAEDHSAQFPYMCVFISHCTFPTTPIGSIVLQRALICMATPHPVAPKQAPPTATVSKQKANSSRPKGSVWTSNVACHPGNQGQAADHDPASNCLFLSLASSFPSWPLNNWGLQLPALGLGGKVVFCGQGQYFHHRLLRLFLFVFIFHIKLENYLCSLLSCWHHLKFCDELKWFWKLEITVTYAYGVARRHDYFEMNAEHTILQAIHRAEYWTSVVFCPQEGACRSPEHSWRRSADEGIWRKYLAVTQSTTCFRNWTVVSYAF